MTFKNFIVTDSLKLSIFTQWGFLFVCLSVYFTLIMHELVYKRVHLRLSIDYL